MLKWRDSPGGQEKKTGGEEKETGAQETETGALETETGRQETDTGGQEMETGRQETKMGIMKRKGKVWSHTKETDDGYNIPCWGMDPRKVDSCKGKIIVLSKLNVNLIGEV